MIRESSVVELAPPFRPTRRWSSHHHSRRTWWSSHHLFPTIVDDHSAVESHRSPNRTLRQGILCTRFLIETNRAGGARRRKENQSDENGSEGDESRWETTQEKGSGPLDRTGRMLCDQRRADRSPLARNGPGSSPPPATFRRNQRASEMTVDSARESRKEATLRGAISSPASPRLPGLRLAGVRASRPTRLRPGSRDLLRRPATKARTTPAPRPDRRRSRTTRPTIRRSTTGQPLATRPTPNRRALDRP